jgi:hypothetical protein
MAEWAVRNRGQTISEGHDALPNRNVRTGALVRYDMQGEKE